MNILYEDNHLLVLNKDAGRVMQEAPGSADDLTSCAKAFIKERDQKPGGVFLHAVHRLDKPVSGIAVFAKTQKALERMNRFIREGRFNKIYFALVEGEIPASGHLKDYLFHGDHKAVLRNSPQEGYKRAELTFRRLRQGHGFSLVEINLLTGRYHQIRAQLSNFGYPIVNDDKYGSRIKKAAPGICLHHGKVSFPHPVKEETLLLECQVPAYFDS
ncbi:RluA family pseudouridine synthase [Estrella lausannensis]|uniref:Pseudouridine synthase, RluA family n=1 Tax=Estrella lausannensis TaxID=483423 RepID=A0A0H5E649_9BACT|nr:RNA pseudouridine synthase [Estrella lausannensis]CRX38735.1 pseudouridine synthase, RluA family [Estrella lausannensis]